MPEIQYKMKKGLILLLVFMITAVPALSQEDIYHSTYLVLDSEISSTLEVIREPGASIDYIKTELYYFPIEDKRQTILDITTEPQATIAGGKITFNWGSTEENLLRYKVTSSVQVENKFEKVYNKINFPITAHIPADVVEYINPTEKIDSGNKDVIAMANSIAEGEDDLFIVIHNIAAWVKENIEYSLTTVTAEATKKASWVLDERYGVCDELTALFMAMSRSLGIPARFISGISYTNDPQFEEQWGPHGWAEIYLPGYGWVPFDVTYGELGWIDPSHIKLSESIDPDKPSAEMEWKGKNFEIQPRQLELTAEIKEMGGAMLDTVDIKASIAKRKVKFGSYNLAEVEIKNLRDYYVTTDITLSIPKEVEVEGKKSLQFILKPSETKKLFWILKVDSNLERKYVYTFPGLVYNQRNTEDTLEFKAGYENPSYSRDEMSELMKHLSDEEEKTYSMELEINCKAAKEAFYAHESNFITCTLANKGNTVLDDVETCLDGQCQTIDLTIAQTDTVNFVVQETNAGERDLIITAENWDVSVRDLLTIVVLDAPGISIENIIYPQEIGYKEKGKIEFTVMKESFSDIYNLNVMIEGKRLGNLWQVRNLNATKKFIFDFPGSNLANGDNDVSIIIEYEDSNKRKYTIKKDFKIKLAGLTIPQKLMSKIKGIGFFFENFF